MKKILLFLVSIFAFLTASAQSETQKALANSYLEKFSSFAVEEMHRSGVPASITLAQGMLESNYGRSELAVKANNHFGIQCGKAWTGKSVEHMDSGELRQFRKYDTALESYRDHSDFLLRNKRYSSLFQLDRKDYKGWAKGLKAAGYAEDPAYADKLIRIIEMYHLDVYDGNIVPSAPVEVEEQKPLEQKQEDKEPVRRTEKKNKKNDEKEENVSKTYRYSITREHYSQNGVPFVYTSEGETYEQIAKQYNLFLKEILSFNDALADCKMSCGTVVYLQAKKGKAAKGNEIYVVEEGMGMREISQKYAVRLKKLYRMNKVKDGYIPEIGEEIRLR